MIKGGSMNEINRNDGEKPSLGKNVQEIITGDYYSGNPILYSDWRVRAYYRIAS